MATKYSQLPATILDEERRLPSLARYLLNKAVTIFGVTIENALAERVNVGNEEKPQMEARYTLSQLLDPSFRLPRAMNDKANRGQIGSRVKSLFGSGKRARRAPGKGKKPPQDSLMQMWLERHSRHAS